MFPTERLILGSGPNLCQTTENDIYGDGDMKCKNLDVWYPEFGKCFLREFYDFDLILTECPFGYYKDLWKCRPDCKATRIKNCGIAACARYKDTCISGVFGMIGETFSELLTLGTASSIKSFIKG